jgi:hypothetical protein
MVLNENGSHTTCLFSLQIKTMTKFAPSRSTRHWQLPFLDALLQTEAHSTENQNLSTIMQIAGIRPDRTLP